jgi:NADH-quinone oxidoreductase subunit E
MSTVDALSAAERADISDIVAQSHEPRAACTDVLRYVQARRRYIDDALLGEIAGLLDMSTAELDEVATFYNLIFRRPVGETVLFLCNSVTCWMLGQPALQAHLQRRLGIAPGQTTADGRLTLLPIVCLGHCDHAPAMLLGEALHGDLDGDRLDELLSWAPA